MKIWVHSLVCNEENFIWFAIMSVVDYVDKVLIWDTGSTDKTVNIIEELIKLKGDKISFKEVGRVDKYTLPKMRQAMIDQSKCDWIFIVDGDEIWSSSQLQKLLNLIYLCSENIIGFVNRTRNCIGDIFHYLPDSAGQYLIGDMKGNLNIRLMRKTKDLKVGGKYPLESYANSGGPVTSQNKNLQFINCWYLHTSFLERSSHDKQKGSGSLGRQKFWEKGISINIDELPEVFKLKRPDIIPDPYKKRSRLYEVISSLVTPIIQFKRTLR